MKLLQKILFVAMIGVAGWNLETNGMGVPPPPAPPAPILNLPNNTPGLKGALQNQRINVVANERCHHIVVPNTPANNAFNAHVGNNAAKIQAAMGTDGNIYFPRNGVQPTTPEAVQYSCANIDNRENSSITEWYMMMFGVIPINHAAIAAAVGAPPAPVFVHAGWDNAAPPAAQAIIRFNANVDMVNVVYDPDHGRNIFRKELFIQKFCKIASTSVGRVLLYRILIEIRRQAAIRNPVGCYATDVPPPHPMLNNRNSCRSIEIIWGNFCFASAGSISITNFVPPLTTLGNEGVTYDDIIVQGTSIDVAILHEMIHWYHWLRNTNRYITEFNRAGVALNFNSVNAHIGLHYWGGIDPAWTPAHMAVSENIWSNIINVVGAGPQRRVAFEEIRTILGVPNGIHGYIEGDDISENLYRTCLGIPFRFGYGNVPFYEDNIVINRIIESVTSRKNFYKCIARSNRNVGFLYANPTNRSGLGNCRIFP